MSRLIHWYGQVANITPSLYFDKKRGLASGIVCAGGGLGGMAISHIMNSITQRTGPAWTFRIVGFFASDFGEKIMATELLFCSKKLSQYLDCANKIDIESVFLIQYY